MANNFFGETPMDLKLTSNSPCDQKSGLVRLAHSVESPVNIDFPMLSREFKTGKTSTWGIAEN